MSQTLGVGFAVTLLQSWFILIIIDAILECKPWYCKAKVIHLWSVKYQILLFLKIVIKFAGRHLAKCRRQSLVERQGASGQHHSIAFGEAVRQPGSQLCGTWYFHKGHSQHATVLGSCLCAGPVWGYSDFVVCCLWYLCRGLLSPVLQLMEVWIGKGALG